MAQHAFKIGQTVKVLPNVLPVTSRSEAQELEHAKFEIVRLMPQSGSRFQYRIKEKTSGQERLVAEPEIALSEP